MPFDASQDLPAEETRLKYRFLDLRRPSLQHALRQRFKITQATRTYLEHHDFVEIETPLLFKSTPEGAAEFIIPTQRPHLFYALPQSPQQVCPTLDTL